MPDLPYRILLVDDHEEARELVRRLLGRLTENDPLISVEVLEAESVAVAKDSISAIHSGGGRLDLIILDYHFENEKAEEQREAQPNGRHLLRWLRDNGFDEEVIMLTGFGFPELTESVFKLGAYAYIDKRTLGKATEPQEDGSIGLRRRERFYIRFETALRRIACDEDGDRSWK